MKKLIALVLILLFSFNNLFAIDFSGLTMGGLTALRDLTDIPGCTLYLDATDASTITLNGSDVSGWADKSDQGNDAAESTNQGEYIIAALNGLNGIEFDGSEGLRTSYEIDFSAGFTILIVYEDYDLGANDTMLGQWQAAGSNRRQFIITSGSGENDKIKMTGLTQVNTAFSVSIDGLSDPTDAGYLVYTNDLSNGNIYGNSVIGFNSPAPKAHSNTATRNFNIGGADSSGAYGYVGRVYMIAIWERALSTYERNQVEGFVASKFAL